MVLNSAKDVIGRVRIVGLLRLQLVGGDSDVDHEKEKEKKNQSGFCLLTCNY